MSDQVTFKLGGNTTLNLSVGDITDWEGDAIVNAANERMLGGGGVAIHRAAGPELRRLCQEVPTVSAGARCPTGEARITGGANLPAKYVIHTVGPVYDAQPPEEAADLLGSAYRNSLKLANENGCKSIAFPAISCGVFGYPYKDAAEVAFETCKEHAGDLSQVDFVFFSKPTPGFAALQVVSWRLQSSGFASTALAIGTAVHLDWTSADRSTLSAMHGEALVRGRAFSPVPLRRAPTCQPQLLCRPHLAQAPRQHLRQRRIQLCRCAAGDGSKPFLVQLKEGVFRQLSEWRANLFGRASEPTTTYLTAAQRLAAASDLQQQSLPPIRTGEPSAATASTSDEGPSTSSSPLNPNARPFTPGAAFHRLNDAFASHQMSPEERETVRRKAVKQQVTEVFQDYLARNGEEGEIMTDWEPDESDFEGPDLPSPPEEGVAAPWAEWQEYFEEMDQHAVWCRDAQLFANMLAEGDRFEHAQRFRDELDEERRGGPVAQVIREFEDAVEEQDFAKAAHLRDAGGVGLLGWWYAVGDERRPGGHLLHIVQEPYHGSYSGYMVTGIDFWNVESQTPDSIIRGELGQWHAMQEASRSSGIQIRMVDPRELQKQQEASSEQQQGASSGGPAEGNAEVEVVGMAEPERIYTADDIGLPIMEMYITQEADGSLSQQASALRYKRGEGPMLIEDEAPGLLFGGDLSVNGQIIAMPMGDEPSTSGDASRRDESPDEVIVQEVILDSGELEATYAEQMERRRASLRLLDRNRFSISVEEDLPPIPVPADDSASVSTPAASGSSHQASNRVLAITDGSEKLRDQDQEASTSESHRLMSVEKALKLKELKGLMQKLHDAVAQMGRPELTEPVVQMAFHSILMQLRAMFNPEQAKQEEQAVYNNLRVAREAFVDERESRAFAQQGYRGTTQYVRIPTEFPATDPFSGVFMDPFVREGPELYLLERAKAENGEESVTATKLTSNQNVRAGTVAFRAGLGPSTRLPVAGVYADELGVLGRHKGQCRLSNAVNLNARWEDAELLRFSSSAPHGADLGLATGGRSTGHNVAWLKRLQLSSER
ncbi:hypothetical protein WJX73_010191 [Symbiochloris irregularis]|uniref:Macro domain-containing protein n=1 Tax=Symbiochloris irregularis TaxID=706552 RepID=A0AAW1NS53_9CHLO